MGGRLFPPGPRQPLALGISLDQRLQRFQGSYRLLELPQGQCFVVVGCISSFCRIGRQIAIERLNGRAVGIRIRGSGVIVHQPTLELVHLDAGIHQLDQRQIGVFRLGIVVYRTAVADISLIHLTASGQSLSGKILDLGPVKLKASDLQNGVIFCHRSVILFLGQVDAGNLFPHVHPDARVLRRLQCLAIGNHGLFQALLIDQAVADPALDQVGQGRFECQIRLVVGHGLNALVGRMVRARRHQCRLGQAIVVAIARQKFFPGSCRGDIVPV